MQIIDFFKELANRHTRLVGFIYGETEATGNTSFPLLRLHDPIEGKETNGLMEYTCRIDILHIPGMGVPPEEIQKETYFTGLVIIEKIRSLKYTSGYDLPGFEFKTLQNQGAEGATGTRFILKITAPNPVNKDSNDFIA